MRGQSVQAGRGRADGLCGNGVAAPYDHEMALPGGLEPPACGLGNRRSVLVSYGSQAPRKTPGLARAHCGTDASAHYAQGVRTDGLLRDPDVVVYGEELL